MKEATKRSIFRWIHIICGIPILGYIYSPFGKLPDYAPQCQVCLSSCAAPLRIWMWKGHVVRRLFRKDRRNHTLQRTA